jgi:diaminopimelate epimerase
MSFLRSDDNGMIGDVDMGAVSFEPYQIPFTGDDPMKVPVMLLGKERIGVAANSGVPHLVITLDSRDELEDEALSHEALVLRYDDRFPDNTNVTVIVIESRNKVSARVFERGAHETLSCGTAATAIAAILQKQGDIANEVAVSLRGGELFVHLDHSAILSGPVNKISSCDYAL